jgi:hypothetical protein
MQAVSPAIHPKSSALLKDVTPRKEINRGTKATQEMNPKPNFGKDKNSMIPLSNAKNTRSRLIIFDVSGIPANSLCFIETFAIQSF